MRPKVQQLDALLCEILAEDSKRRGRSRRTIPSEVTEAMDYYVAWGLARSRAEALVRLAQPLSVEVVAKVRSLDVHSVGRRMRRRTRLDAP
jgi:hypothetical protein